MAKKSNLLLIFCLIPLINFAQGLSLTDFLKTVKENHPIAKAASNIKLSGTYEVLQARGVFDPTLTFDGNQKKFKGNDYYTNSYGQLKLPVFYGFDIKTGFEKNYGQYLDNESITPTSGLANLGIQFSLFDVLLTDERRYVLRTAKVNANQLKNEGTKVLNKLLYDAGNEYCGWVQAYNNQQVKLKAVNLALDRLNATRIRSLKGDLATIDTIDALSEYQKRVIELNQANFELKIKKYEISVFLWKDTIPLNLSESSFPINTPLIKEQMSDTANRDVIKVQLKLNQLALDKKLAYRSFFPDINFGYNILYQSNKISSPFEDNYIGNNYKMMGGIYYPLFLRKARGKYSLIQNKINISVLELLDTKRIFNTNVLINKQASDYIGNQIKLQQDNIKNLEILTNAEKRRFSIGESTVFLVNARELKYLDAQYKLIELEAKLIKNSVQYYYLIGTFVL